MIVTFCKILNLLRSEQVDNNVIFEILILLDSANEIHREIFDLLIKFLTNYDENILETIRLVCLLQIADYIQM